MSAVAVLWLLQRLMQCFPTLLSWHFLNWSTVYWWHLHTRFWLLIMTSVTSWLIKFVQYEHLIQLFVYLHFTSLCVSRSLFAVSNSDHTIKNYTLCSICVCPNLPASCSFVNQSMCLCVCGQMDVGVCRLVSQLQWRTLSIQTPGEALMQTL